MTDDAIGANSPALPNEPKNRSERWLRTHARRRDLRIERSRCRLDVDTVRPFWLCVGLELGVLRGFILRDAVLEEIDAFFCLPAETQQVAIEIAEALEAMSRIEIDNPDSWAGFDLAHRIQAVMQRALLTEMSADERASILAEAREIALEGPNPRTGIRGEAA